MALYAKQPGLGMKPRVVMLDTAYRTPDEPVLEAYETLLLEVIEGRRALFIRFDEVEHAWRVVDPILERWSAEGGPIPTYSAGTWGSEEASALLARQGHAWRNHI